MQAEPAGEMNAVKRGMETRRLFMKPDDMRIDMKSSVSVYPLELVRILL